MQLNVKRLYDRREYRPLGQLLWEYCQTKNYPVKSPATLARYFQAHFSRNDPYQLPGYWNRLLNEFLTDNLKTEN